jgi:hypothetical protein
MNRRTILNIFAMTALGLALLPSSIVAQQGTLRQQLVGTWTLVSEEITAPNGTKQEAYGANPKGLLIFDAGGRYAIVGGRPDRPKFKSASQPTTEELAAATAGFGANFGTWSVNETDKTLTLHFDFALRPNNEGEDRKFSVSLAGDELKLTGINLRRDPAFRRVR